MLWIWDWTARAFPLTLTRLRCASQRFFYRIAAEGTILGGFFAIWWRMSHNAQKASLPLDTL